MGIRDDFNHFNDFVSRVGTSGIGDYMELAILGNLIHAKNQSFWFVDPGSGSDAYDGDHWSTPFQTIQAAVDAAGDGRGDTIFLLNGRGTDYDDDTVGASVANAYVNINKSDLSIIGLGPPNSVVIKPDAAATAGVFSIASGANRVRIANITFNTATAQSAAIQTVSGAHYPTIENCIFDLVGAAGPTGAGITFDAGKVSYPIIRNCTFYCGTLIIAAIIMECQDATPFGALIQGCNFISVLNGAGTGIVDFINVKDGTGVHIDKCYMHGGDAGTAYNATDGIDIDAGCVSTIITDCLIGNCDNGVVDGGTDSCGETAGEGWVDITHS